MDGKDADAGGVRKWPDGTPIAVCPGVGAVAHDDAPRIWAVMTAPALEESIVPRRVDPGMIDPICRDAFEVGISRPSFKNHARCLPLRSPMVTQTSLPVCMQ